ncbi:MAG: ATP-grasp domain-containing protein, partial [Xanthobacteraceae bacterium]|nr:ATP-grasp domain-containing protein [Xanthobacteraceae bacterium]
SYLDIERVIEVARRAGAQCIHPGYGFLSENAEFAEAVLRANIAFVGPSPAAIRAMGLKDRAKALMEKAGVPVVPGYHGDQQTDTFLKRKAYEIGYPVLIKAVAGGGGRGMRRVDKHADFDDAVASARREAESAFGDQRVLVEKYIEAPRHIELQVFGDGGGQVIHLNERDCSLQRRHQKVIEEAPAPGMTPELRAEMGRAAVEAARAIGYVGAGTVEFIASAEPHLQSGRFWFMEMNTRLQVEHPVTEAITGFDLVEWQFRIAAGESLPVRQEEVPLQGHAVEARLYAEDPDRGFLPSPGRVIALDLPHGERIRVDAGIAAGLTVPPDYDPMIAKVIAHGATRDEALDRLAAALADTVVIGPRVNTPFLRALVTHPRFRAGKFDTGFIDAHLPELIAVDPAEAAQAGADGVLFLLERERLRVSERGGAGAPNSWSSPWAAGDGFSLGPPRRLAFDIVVDGAARQAVVAWGPDGARVSVDGLAGQHNDRVVAMGDGVVVAARRQHHVAFKRADASGSARAGEDAARAPMNGKVIAVLVAPGEAVKLGARVAVMEAMKMEHSLTAPRDGTVAEAAAVGAQVIEGDAVVRLEPAPRASESGKG